jgi:hypothetical protein
MVDIFISYPKQRQGQQLLAAFSLTSDPMMDWDQGESHGSQKNVPSASNSFRSRARSSGLGGAVHVGVGGDQDSGRSGYCGLVGQVALGLAEGYAGSISTRTIHSAVSGFAIRR